MTEPHNINRSFADNVNYLSELDKQYCKNGYIVRNGIQLGTQEYFGKATINVFSTELKQHIVTNLYSGSIIGNDGLEQFIGLVCSSIESIYPDIEVSYSVTDSASAIIDKNLEIVFNSTNTIVGLITINISLVINGSVASYAKYSLTSGSDNYISVLPYLAMLDDDFNNSIFNIGKYSEEIKNVNDNIDNVNTVSDSIDNVNLVGSSVASVRVVASNIDAVIAVGDLDNIEDIKRVASDLNSIDDNMRADITTVANDLTLGANSNVAKVSTKIDDVVTVGNSISGIVTVSNDIESVVSVVQNIDDIVINSNNMSSINTNAANIIAIQNAEENANIATSGASIATTKSNEASSSALSASSSAEIATLKASKASASEAIAVSSANSAIESATIASTKASEASLSAINANNSAIISTDQASISTTNAANSTLKAAESLASAAQSHSSANTAISSASSALVSEANAKDSMEKAEKWAEEPEDVEVEAGRYSAKHWALKAKDFSTGSASNINYNGALSGLSSVDVQSAIDELDGNIDLLSSNKVDKIVGKSLSTEDYTTSEKSKLAGIASGAQVNVPTNLSLGTATAVNIPLNSSTGTDVNLPSATTSTAGLLSAADKTKLDGVADNANNYILPTATATVKGGVEIFSDTVQSVAANSATATAGRTYGIQLNSAGQAVVNVPWTDTNTVYTHPTSGVTAGTYRSVTVDVNGHITAGTNPTTVNDYGITDVYTKTENNTSLALKANNSEKGVANGIATLDSNGKVVLTQIPDSVLGQLEYMGTWNLTTFPTATQKGQYWIASVSGNEYTVGDWAVWNGTAFDKVDNTDAVATVAGKTGNVVLTKSDVGLANVDNTADSAKPVSTAQQTALNLKANLNSPTFTGIPAAPTASTGTNTTQVATTAFVVAEINKIEEW